MAIHESIKLLFLPEACLDQIITRYLKLKDVAQLDIAMCDSQHRHIFIQLLNRSITFDNTNDVKTWKTDSGIMKWLVFRNVQLMKLSLSAQFLRDSKENCVAYMELLSTVCAPTLQSFKYAGSYHWGYNVGVLAARAHIPIDGILPTIENMSISVLIFFLSACRNLNSLDMSNCKLMTSTAIIAIAPHLSKLKILDISFTRITNDGIVVSAEHFPNLVSLLLYGVNVNDAGILAITKYCKYIQTFFVNGMSDITDCSLFEIANSWPDMKQISLQNCHHLTNMGFTSLAARLRKLQYINLFDMPTLSSSVLITLIMNNPLLEYVRILEFSFTQLDLNAITLCLAQSCISIQFDNILISHNDVRQSILLQIFMHSKLSA